MGPSLRQSRAQYWRLKAYVLALANQYAEHYLAAFESKRAIRLKVVVSMAKREQLPVNTLPREYDLLRPLKFQECSAKLVTAVRLVNFVQVAPVVGRWRLDVVANRTLNLTFNIQEQRIISTTQTARLKCCDV